MRSTIRRDLWGPIIDSLRGQSTPFRVSAGGRRYRVTHRAFYFRYVEAFLVMLKKLLSAFFTLLLLSGCAHKQHMLKPIKKEKAHFVQEQENVELRMRVLTPGHCQKHFGHSMRPRSSQHPALVQCTIMNNSKTLATFAHHNTSLSLLTQKEVYKLIEDRFVVIKGLLTGLAIAWIPLATVLGISIIAPSLTAHGHILEGFVLCSILLAFYGTLPIIAVSVPTSCIMGLHKNKKISQKICQKIPEKITVAPGQTQNFLLFAHALPSSFTMTLTREQQEPLVFNVQIPDTCVCTFKKQLKKKTAHV